MDEKLSKEELKKLLKDAKRGPKRWAKEKVIALLKEKKAEEDDDVIVK